MSNDIERLAVVDAALAQARREQMEEDCKCVCSACLQFGEPLLIGGKWKHGLPPVTQDCAAAPIRARFEEKNK